VLQEIVYCCNQCSKRPDESHCTEKKTAHERRPYFGEFRFVLANSGEAFQSVVASHGPSQFREDDLMGMMQGEPMMPRLELGLVLVFLIAVQGFGCTSSTDTEGCGDGCAKGSVCAYRISDGCSAQASCVPFVSSGALSCPIAATFCACTGGDVKLACDAPQGYSRMPVRGEYSCDDGGVADAGADLVAE
jgi:hypothetical protein